MTAVALHLGTRNPYVFDVRASDVTYNVGCPAHPVLQSAALTVCDRLGTENTLTGVLCETCTEQWGMDIRHASFEHARACMAEREHWEWVLESEKAGRDGGWL